MSNIVNASDLKKYMKKTLDDGQAVIVVDAVNEFIEQRTGRVWGGDETEVTEVYDFKGSIWLKQQGVTSITSVKLGFAWAGSRTVIPSDSYYLDSAGRLMMVGYPPSSTGARDFVEVTYKYHNAKIPADLKQAALALAAGMYNWANNGQRDVSSVSVGNYHVQYGSGGGAFSKDSGKSIGDLNVKIIDSYRAPRV